MSRWVLLAVLLAPSGCKNKATAPTASPPTPALAPAGTAEQEPIRRLGPQEIKARVEGAEQKHEERMDKRFDEAQKQGE